jgi:hypothetical protein
MSGGNTNNTVFIQKLFTSRDNFVDGNVQEATANTANYVGQEGRIWWNPDLNAFYYSDGNTPGGFLINGPVGNGQPGGPLNSVQINNGDGNFYGSANFIYDGSNVTVAGNVNASYFIGNGSQLTDINTNKIFNDTSYANIENPNGNLEVNINSYSWIFDSIGNLEVPGSITGNGNSLLDLGFVYGGNTVYLTTTGNDSTALYLDATIAQLYANSNVTIGANVGGSANLEWKFDSTGNLTVPANSTISPLSDDLTLDADGNVYIKSKGHTFLFDSDTVGRLIMPPSGIIAVDDAVGNGLNLFVGNTSTEIGNTWNFGINGDLTTPGNIIIDNIGDANISSDSNINIISNSNIWDFHIDGNLTLPGNGEISINYANGYPYGVTNITGLAAGNTTEVQFNLDGNFSASANFTYDDTTQELTVLGNAQFNNANLGNLATANNFSTNGSGGDITLIGGNITGANVIDANTLVGTDDGNIYVTGNILPSSGTYNLGLPSSPWANAYFGPLSVTLLDDTGNLANSVTIENLAANITMGTAGFNIVKLGTADSIFRIESLTGRISSNALTVISNDTNSANATSGSLQTAGGAGIVKNLYVGGNIYGEGSTISNVVTYVTVGVGLSGGGTGNVGIDATGVQSITGTANRIIVTDLGGQNFNISAPQDLNTSSTLTFANLTITGNLTVNGTTTTANSANLDSKVLYLAANSTSNSQIDQGGIVLGNVDAAYAVSILYDLNNNQWNTDGAGLTTLNLQAANANIDFLNVQTGGHFGLINEQLDYPNAYVQVDANVNSYSQIVSQNHSPGTAASSDLVLVNDIGDDGNHYIDMGINGSNYTDPAFSSTLANDGYLFVNQGNLVIGTDTPSETIKFVAGGTTSNDIVLTISNTGLVTPGNAQANYFIGNGSQLTGLPAGNIVGQVANALVAGTVYTNAQPNITSVGTLTGLTSNGIVNFANTSNVTLGAVSNLHIAGGSANYILQTNGSNTLSWVVNPGIGAITTILPNALNSSNHIAATTVGNTATIITDATTANTANTIVLRDANGAINVNGWTVGARLTAVNYIATNSDYWIGTSVKNRTITLPNASNGASTGRQYQIADAVHNGNPNTTIAAQSPATVVGNQPSQQGQIIIATYIGGVWYLN